MKSIYLYNQKSFPSLKMPEAQRAVGEAISRTAVKLGGTAGGIQAEHTVTRLGNVLGT